MACDYSFFSSSVTLVEFFSVPCCEAFSEPRLNRSDFACVGFLSGAVDVGGSYSSKRALPLLFINIADIVRFVSY
jgi:hypothetical protein